MNGKIKDRTNLLRVVADFPAWAVWERAKNAEGLTEIHSEENLALAGGKYPFSHRFYAYTLEEYYAKDGRELTEERRAQSEKNHRDSGSAGLYDYWLQPIAACLTAHERPKEECIAIHIGMRVLYKGQRFTIEKAPNDNLKFVRIE